MIDALGRCSECGKICQSTSGCNCQQNKSEPGVGWVCPVCGAGNAPWNGTCQCKKPRIKGPFEGTPIRPTDTLKRKW
jgi:hypothetical protein